MKFLIFFLISFQVLAYTPTPQILSDADVFLYKESFENKKINLNNSTVDSIIKGVFLSELYLSNGYKTSKKDLRNWLNNYSDLPNASKIYKLAKSKKVANIKRPSIPKRSYRIHYSSSRYSSLIRNKYTSKFVLKKIKEFKKSIHKGHSKNAKNILQNSKFKKALRKTDYNRLCGKLAFMYFLDEMYSRAKKWAKPASKTASNASWVMGLISFIKDDYETAGKYFEKVKNANQEKEYMNAQGAFWAYKAYKTDGNSKKADEMLQFASKKTDSFYGILAGEKLGLTKNINWLPFRMTIEDAQEILSWKGGMRALALIQIGELELAEQELKYLIKFDHSSSLMKAVLALASQENLPHFSLDVGRNFIGYQNKDLYNSALYPVPNWTPDIGWQVDKSIVLGVIRQESRFKTSAKSWVGANGLMQIMPATASFIEKDKSLKKRNRYKLNNPSFNLSVGQKYIKFLTRILGDKNDLIRILGSYNAGPKTVLDFDKKVKKHGDDPLLYLECFPAKETRSYIKNVLMNIWKYQLRFEGEARSLEELSENNFPKYE
ncbi:MAG: lytic transglycosylase domain-containing protein [Alphaproteobacteria bacterium]|nr:MAG: hypothetical protein B6I23_02250 [Rickettsiaceae bacterium 4572_127]